MMARMVFLALFLFLNLSQIALGQELVSVAGPVATDEPIMSQEVCTSIVCEALSKFPEVNAWLIAIFTFIGLMLRATADLLGFVATRLAKAELGVWAKKLGSWALWSAQVVGWFGGGTPKVVLAKKVEKAIGEQSKG
jgi:hypothetical protein